jgi:hypothetical protein
MNLNFPDKIKAELAELDRESVQVEGQLLKPSQCYRIGFDPPHILYNTNCPRSLREKVQAILSKYWPSHESGPSQ